MTVTGVKLLYTPPSPVPGLRVPQPPTVHTLRLLPTLRLHAAHSRDHISDPLPFIPHPRVPLQMEQTAFPTFLGQAQRRTRHRIARMSFELGRT